MNEEKKIILHPANLKNTPECPHGPALLFSRGVGARRFYACSAYRDRKFCDFFLWEDDKITEGKKLAWSIARDKLLPKVNHEEMHRIKAKVQKAVPSSRAYCNTCSCLFLLDDVQAVHRGHDITTKISDHLLSHPSKLIKLKESAKKESQFLFDISTIECLVSGLKSLQIEKLLCIGTPSLKESCPLPSLLLDIDHRYASFYDSTEFLWFNLSNFYFFGEKGLDNLKRCIANTKCAIVIDPPFGALLEPISSSVSRIIAECNLSNPPVLLILPYFMEKQVLNYFPNFIMLDYEVNYSNHNKFNASGRKQGSPVRIFTNIKKFPLPKSEGYHLCELCCKWVSDKSKHCPQCNDCTSKNGSTYNHCGICQKCVKPTWKHCKSCQKCTLLQHDCSLGENPFKQMRIAKGGNKRKGKRDATISKKSKYISYTFFFISLSSFVRCLLKFETSISTPPVVSQWFQEVKVHFLRCNYN